MTLADIRGKWDGFWFSEEPYLDLGIMRIGVVGLQLITLVSDQFENLTRVTGLPTVLYRPVGLVKVLSWLLGWSTPLSGHTVFAIYWITLLFGFGALLGLRTGVCMIVLAAGSVFLQTYVYSFTDFHHNEAILLLALTALAFGPCGRVLSLDSLLARRRPGARLAPLLDYRGAHAGWPVKFVQCLFPMVYLSASLSKIAAGGYTLDWANGYTLQYYFLQDSLRKPDMALGLFASHFHVAILLAQIIVLSYQLTYFLVVPYPRLRWVYLPLGLFFHLANYYALRAPFPEWILLLGVYVPWTAALRRLVQAEVPADVEARPPVVASGPPVVDKVA